MVAAAATATSLAPAATATASGQGAAAAPRRGQRPNIVLIVLDDLGWGELGCYGQEEILTPHIDALAAEGVGFEEAYATPTCASTRSSLFQGLHTGHARVRSNAHAGAGLLPENLTFAEVLQEAGYRTALFGKWGLGPDNGDNPSHPNSKGFDEFFGYINQRHAHDYWPTYLWRNGERVEFPENDGADVTYAPELFTREALDFLDRVAARRRGRGHDGGSGRGHDGDHDRGRNHGSYDEPFFLALTYTTPHAPNEIPDDAPYSDEEWPEGERNHAAQITWTDGEIGKVVARLKERGLLEDTLVLVTSDNGPHREGANYGHVGSNLPHKAEFFNSNADLRGTKRDLYEGGIRVPLVARLPRSLRRTSKLRRGSWIEEPVALWDLFPTFTELAQTATPDGLDGVSLLPLLRGRRAHDRPYLYWEFHEGGYDQAVRWGRWKVIRHDGGARTELFDISTDRAEKIDLAGIHPDVVIVGERLIDASVTPRV